MTASNSDLKEFISKAVQLRNTADGAEAKFMQFLARAEDNRIWEGSYASFDELLRQEQICAVGRYRAYMSTVRNLGEETVAKLGFAASRKVLSIPDVSIQKKVKSALVKWADKNGSVPGGQVAKAAIQKLVPSKVLSAMKPVRVSASTGLKSENQKLVKENNQLKEEVSRLQKENTELKRLMRENGVTPLVPVKRIKKAA